MLIRTSGEKRISNFLLWQIAYSELYFSEKKWPDFDAEELYMAIFEYQKKEKDASAKQLNKLKMKSFKLLLILILHCYFVFGQQETTNSKYILGGIELEGNHNFDNRTILRIMNLSIGQEISAPSEEITNGVKALWNQNFFSDIQVWKRLEDNKKAILEIYLESLPSLTKFKLLGLKNRKKMI